MKTYTKHFILPLFFIVFSVCAYAQTTIGINYQAIARDVNGVPLVNQKVGLRFTITTPGSPIVTNYQETTTVTSNSLGLITYVIGSGTPVTGTFAAIPWTGAIKSLLVEMDPTGGTNYTISMGTQQLQAVPYSFLSRYTSTISNLPIDSLGNVKITGVTAGNILVYNGSKWANTTQWLQSGTSLYYSAGNVGIGTTTPSYPLHISTSSYPGIQMDGSNASWTGMYIRNSSTGQPFYGYENPNYTAYHYLTPAGAWVLYNGGNYLSVLNNGNVGIGTTTPTSTLQVNGKTTTNTLQVITGAVTGDVLTSDASGNATWQAGNPKVAFNVYATSSPTLVSGANAISFAGVTFNDAGANVSSTGVFTAPVAGTYSFTSTLLLESVASGTELVLELLVNGSIVAGNFQYSTGSTLANISVTSVLKLTAGQTVSVQLFEGTASGYCLASNAYTYFSGYQLY